MTLYVSQDTFIKSKKTIRPSRRWVCQFVGQTRIRSTIQPAHLLAYLTLIQACSVTERVRSRTSGQEDYWVVVLSTVGLLGGTRQKRFDKLWLVVLLIGLQQ